MKDESLSELTDRALVQTAKYGLVVGLLAGFIIATLFWFLLFK